MLGYVFNLCIYFLKYLYVRLKELLINYRPAFAFWRVTKGLFSGILSNTSITRGGWNFSNFYITIPMLEKEWEYEVFFFNFYCFCWHGYLPSTPGGNVVLPVHNSWKDRSWCRTIYYCVSQSVPGGRPSWNVWLSSYSLSEIHSTHSSLSLSLPHLDSLFNHLPANQWQLLPARNVTQASTATSAAFAGPVTESMARTSSVAYFVRGR